MTIMEPKVCGIALDIGTTNVCAYLVCSDGAILDYHSEKNNQRFFGADVISRISAAKEGKLNELCRAVGKNVQSIIDRFKSKHSVKIDRIAVAANTVMLHLFLNVDPSSMGEYPFTPKFLDSKIIAGKEIGIDAETVYVLPSFSAFIGADAVGGLALLAAKEKNALYVDIGTNGEIALKKDGKYYLTSAAAGPAFEGGISCGIGAVPGAIKNVDLVNGKFQIETVGAKPPVGVCGSGFIDILAHLLNLGIIDKDGTFDYGECERLDENGFCLSDGIFVTQNDIRSAQTAIAAVKTAIKLLLKKANVELKDVLKLYITGSFASSLRKENAVAIGLLPKIALNKIEVLDNMSLKSARKCLIDNSFIDECERLKEKSELVEIAKESGFQDEYILNLRF